MSKTAREEYLAEEQRTDGVYRVAVWAIDWAEAQHICDDNGWELKGKVEFTIPATDDFGKEQAESLIADLNASNTRGKQ